MVVVGVRSSFLKSYYSCWCGCAPVIGEPSAFVRGVPSRSQGGPATLFDNADRSQSVPCRSVPHMAQIPSKRGLRPTAWPFKNQRASYGASSAGMLSTPRFVYASLWANHNASNTHSSILSSISALSSDCSAAKVPTGFANNCLQKSSTGGAQDVPNGRFNTWSHSLVEASSWDASASRVCGSPSNRTRQPAGSLRPLPTSSANTPLVTLD